MAPVFPDTRFPPSRRRTFTALCSSDELLGQIIQTLLPEYRVDASHLLALREVLSSAIVTPKKPPRLVRTRPDKRIGQVGSIYDTSQRPVCGPNGPPVSANTSFYFHHKDPDFEKLLPQVDRSGYGCSDQPVDEGIQDSTDPNTLYIPTPTLKRNELSKSPDFVAACASAVCEDKGLMRPIRCPKETCPANGPAYSGTLDPSLTLAQDAAREHPAITPSNLQPTYIPIITITDADSEQLRTIDGAEESSSSVSLLRTADIFADLPDTQEMNGTARSFSIAALPGPYPTDTHTQDSFNSTQQSDVFSPPVDFLPCTPPTQDDSQSEVLPQNSVNDTSDLSTAEKTNKQASQRPICLSAVELESYSLPTPPWNKRLRETLEEANDAPHQKRSKRPS
ncbi:hypothetical protein ST47_g6893 [Ascochyta rabiei]|uniref:Uncharacterized protein n=1 Tax=Didymella rabiei TaxID=5454 RepID=A0A163BT52_DIDRA|nr:hypothetical protein ST47_g6893 [Ascochyta rabiei]